MKEELKVVGLYDKSGDAEVASFNNSIKSEYVVEENRDAVEVNFEWLDLMEETVRYLDQILRNPNRFIVNEEEIVNVEQARRITVESIKHLSRHTNYIQEIDKNGDVRPSKILNILKDESYNTYENRVIYTLILNMRLFVEMRKRDLITESYSKAKMKGEYHGVTRVGNENIKIDINIGKSMSVTDKQNPEETSIEERIEKLQLRIADLTSSEVFKTLAKANVAKVIPPVKKTNLILKNVNFQYAMKLWDYLASYQNDSQKRDKSNVVYKDDKETKKMFDDIFLLNYLLVDNLSDNKKTKREGQSKEAIEDLTNAMINKIVELNADMDIQDIQNIVGQRIAMIRSKKEASLSEIQGKFNEKLTNYLTKFREFELR